MPKPQISNQDAISAMLHFINMNLVLGNVETEAKKQSTIFSGEGLQGTEDGGKRFELEAITSVDRAISCGYLSRNVEEALNAPPKQRIYRVFMFPQSILYHNVAREFKSPYLTPAKHHLKLDEIETNEFMRLHFQDFRNYNSVALTNAEMYVADVHKGGDMSVVIYYDPLHNRLQIVRFIKYDKEQIIPAYFFTRIGLGHYLKTREGMVYSGANSKFWEIQEKLHKRVRKMIVEGRVQGSFTLTRHGRGAIVKACDPQTAQRHPSETIAQPYATIS